MELSEAKSWAQQRLEAGRQASLLFLVTLCDYFVFVQFGSHLYQVLYDN